MVRDRLRRISPVLLLPLVFIGTLAILGGVGAGLGLIGDDPLFGRPITEPSAAPGSGAIGSPRPPGSSPGVMLTPPPGAEVLVGAGDIARCDSDGDEATAALLDAIEGTVFTTGDNVYESGTIDEFRDCYGPSWGRHLARTQPAPGNHDHGTPDLAGYRDQFGVRAGPSDRSWYSYELGAWHVIVLDSDCDKVGGCGPESPQGTWLAADLAASTARCTAAIWHHPRFSSGDHGSDAVADPFWRALYSAGVDVVLNGHDHDYERFAPQDADAVATDDGIRQFVVGTGGAPLREFKDQAANSVVRASIAHGVLRLVLYQSGYDWQFISVDGSFTDAGSSACH